MLINATVYNNGKKVKKFEAINEIQGFKPLKEEFLWLALFEPTPEELDIIFSKFNVHELSLEDLEHGGQISKIEEYEEHVFAVLKQLKLNNKVLEIGDVYIFANKNYLVSIRKGVGDSFDNVRKMVEKNDNLLKKGSGYVLYSLIDSIIDRYFPVLTQLDNELIALESMVFNEDITEKSNIIKDLHLLKSKVRTVKSNILPLLDNVHKLFGGRVPHICNQLDDYYRDAHDHLSRISMFLDNLLETTNSNIQTSVAMITIEDNKITKKLAAWAAIFGIMTFMVGVWGMNFKHMPELDWQYGYLFALSSIFIISSMFYYKFKKTGWL